MPLPRGHAFRKFRVSKNSTGLLLLATRVRDFRDARQPRKLIPLSLKSTLTKQLIASLHRRHLHPGTNTLLAIIGETYHVPGLKNHLKRPESAVSSMSEGLRQGHPTRHEPFAFKQNKSNSTFLHHGGRFHRTFSHTERSHKKTGYHKNILLRFRLLQHKGGPPGIMPRSNH